ncbi:MAG TPA: PHP domain-containing protein [Pseudomonadales bacterium]
MPEIIDLHSHTTASDGALQPEELISLASARGVDVLAVTDHDTTDGLLAAQEAATKYGIQMIHGVEISTRWSGHDIHVVGLGIDMNAAILSEGLKRQCQFRVSRGALIAKKLEKYGIHDALVHAQQIAGRDSVGRPHFARYLMEVGLVKSFDEAFKKYLGAGKGAYVATEWASIEEAIQWIQGSGGLAVLAHPGRYRMTRTKLRSLVKAFKVWGGDAMEVCTPNHEAQMVVYLARLSQDFELLASQGSDFHSPETDWVRLGQFPAMPAECQHIWREEKRLIAN